MVVIMSTISVLLAWTGSGHAISDLLGLDQNPALPVTIDTTLVAPTGKTISVAAGRISRRRSTARNPATSSPSPLVPRSPAISSYPRRTETGVITLRTSTPDADLPAPGTAVTPAQADLMPKLISLNSAPTLSAAAGAQGYRLIGLGRVGRAQREHDLQHRRVRGDQTSLADTPSNLVVDRSYIHGQPQTNAFRGVLLTQRAQRGDRLLRLGYPRLRIRLAGHPGLQRPGAVQDREQPPRGRGENIMFGGADSKSPALSPADIEIRKNQLSSR
jgi:hypothetical protein